MNKYLKYKLKYENLKKLLGGADEAPKETARQRVERMRNIDRQRAMEEAQRERAKLEEEKKIIGYLKKLNNIFLNKTIDTKSGEKKTNLELFISKNFKISYVPDQHRHQIIKLQRSLENINRLLTGQPLNYPDNVDESKLLPSQIKKRRTALDTAHKLISDLQKYVGNANMILNRFKQMMMVGDGYDVIHNLPRVPITIKSWGEYLNMDVEQKKRRPERMEDSEAAPAHRGDSKAHNGREVKEREGREVKVQPHESEDIVIINKDYIEEDRRATNLKFKQNLLLGQNSDGKRVFFAMTSVIGLYNWLKFEKHLLNISLEEDSDGVIFGNKLSRQYTLEPDKRFTFMYTHKKEDNTVDIKFDLIKIINQHLYDSRCNIGTFRAVHYGFPHKKQHNKFITRFPEPSRDTPFDPLHEAIFNIGQLLARKLQNIIPDGYMLCPSCDVIQLNPLYSRVTIYSKDTTYGEQIICIKCSTTLCLKCEKKLDEHREVYTLAPDNYGRAGSTTRIRTIVCPDFTEKTDEEFYTSLRPAGTASCPNCTIQIVKGDLACNHGECRCGMHFCFLCGASLGNVGATKRLVNDNIDIHYFTPGTPCYQKYMGYHFKNLREEEKKAFLDYLDRFLLTSEQPLIDRLGLTEVAKRAKRVNDRRLAQGKAGLVIPPPGPPAGPRPVAPAVARPVAHGPPAGPRPVAQQRALNQQNDARFEAFLQEEIDRDARGVDRDARGVDRDSDEEDEEEDEEDWERWDHLTDRDEENEEDEDDEEDENE
jgi:hypothetical protein